MKGIYEGDHVLTGDNKFFRANKVGLVDIWDKMGKRYDRGQLRLLDVEKCLLLLVQNNILKDQDNEVVITKH